MKTILNKQICAFLEESDKIAALSNVSACTRIPFDKGVCGKCYRDKSVQRIDNVLAFSEHIACDCDSRSELCVPIIVNGKCVGEIDIDSPITSRFGQEEENEMLQAAYDIAQAYLQHHWI